MADDLDLIARARRDAERRECLEAFEAYRGEHERPNPTAAGEHARLRRRRAIATDPGISFPDYPQR